MNSRFFVFALFLSAAALAPQIANAQYGLSSSSNSNSYGDDSIPNGLMEVSDLKNDSHTGFAGPITSGVRSYAGNFTYAMSSGSASGSANYGSLHAEVDSEGIYGDGGNTSLWFDTVTVTSPTLPFGSPVTLLAAASYSGTLDGYVYYGPEIHGVSNVAFKSDVGGVSLSYAASITDLTRYLSPGARDYDIALPISQTLQQTVQTYVGATLTLDSEVDLSANVLALNAHEYDRGSGSVDSVFNIQAQTAGVILTRGSAAVPEPSAFVTILFGVGMLRIVARRRR